MRIVVTALLVFCLMVSQAFASKIYEGWCGGISTAFTPGNRGVIIPVEDCVEKSQFDDLDQSYLMAAMSKAVNYRWTLASGVDSSMTPDQITEALDGQADFFVVVKPVFYDSFEGEFETVKIPYEAKEELQYVTRETDKMGSIINNENYTLPINSHTAYINVAGYEYCYEPVYTEMLVYDDSGRLIFTKWGIWNFDNRENNIRKGAEYVFAGIKDYRSEKNWEKISGDKVKVENVSVWKDPGFKFDKKKELTVLPVTVSNQQFRDSIVVANEIERNIWGVALDDKITTARMDKGAYRLEVDFAIYSANFNIHKPYVSTWTNKTTIEDRKELHDKFHYDTYQTFRLTTGAEGHKGYVSYDINSLGMVFRVYDNATDKLVFSYSGTTHGGLNHKNIALIVEDFFNKLKK